MKWTRCERKLPRRIRQKYERCVRHIKKSGAKVRSPWAICRRSVMKKCRGRR